MSGNKDADPAPTARTLQAAAKAGQAITASEATEACPVGAVVPARQPSCKPSSGSQVACDPCAATTPLQELPNGRSPVSFKISSPLKQWARPIPATHKASGVAAKAEGVAADRKLTEPAADPSSVSVKEKKGSVGCKEVSSTGVSPPSLQAGVLRAPVVPLPAAAKGQLKDQPKAASPPLQAANPTPQSCPPISCSTSASDSVQDRHIATTAGQPSKSQALVGDLSSRTAGLRLVEHAAAVTTEPPMSRPSSTGASPIRHLPLPGTTVSPVSMPSGGLPIVERKRRKVYVVRRHNGSLCTQKQPETAAVRALTAATWKSDPRGGQPIIDIIETHNQIKGCDSRAQTLCAAGAWEEMTPEEITDALF